MSDNILNTIRKYIPYQIFNFFQPIYHYKLALISAMFYRFPSRKIKIIGVTGTKGKSTTVEIINAILEKAGYKTALSNTIRYKIGNDSTPNKFKMSMPGRFFIQKFIKKAVDTKCDYLILEMTSQGTIQFRHKFISLNALVFTNLSPEHIESHGSYEEYVKAKLEIAKELSRSNKRPRIMITNADDKEGNRFLAFEADIKKTYSLNENIPKTSLLGDFNKYNILAAITLARTLGIEEKIIESAILDFTEVPGRVQFIECGQDFRVVVDYAHTADSMEKFYQIFKGKNICVFGAAGGGRDKWKRKEMGKIADKYCDEIILTDDDAYDEDPEQIAKEIAEGIINKIPKIITDRRKAISEGLKMAKTYDNVLITGKGTDAYLMGPDGKKLPWNDAEITREELGKIAKTII